MQVKITIDILGGNNIDPNKKDQHRIIELSAANLPYEAVETIVKSNLRNAALAAMGGDLYDR